MGKHENNDILLYIHKRDYIGILLLNGKSQKKPNNPLECAKMEQKDLEFVPPDDKIREILETNQVIAIVGLSDKKERYSNRVGKFLKARGYTIIPVNPKYETVLGEKSYPSLKDIPEDVDIVDIFRKPEAVGEIVDEAIEKAVKVVWMQEGVINYKAAQKAKDAGLKVVMDRCMYKEYERLHYQ
jgi:predicted CoA-binding protein